MKLFLFLMAFIFFAGQSFTQTIKVPFDKSSVMLDGRFEETEWKKAARVFVNDSTALYVKQDNENIYWCIHTRSSKPALMMVDFYFQQSLQQINLHASAKLGERPWQNNSYGEWIWWNNEYWQANLARNDNKIFLLDEAKEFQLRKSRFNGKEFRLMLDISYPQTMLIKHPAGAVENDSNTWLRFVL